MEIDVTTIIILVFCIVPTYERKPIGKLTDLEAVTRFEGIENFYHALQQEKSETPPQESKQFDKNVNIKKTLCRNIFTSNYFLDLLREDWIDLDVKENRKELKNWHPEIFRSIYRERRTLCLSFGTDSCYSYKYENNYKSLPVSVDGLKGDEYVFVCLVRDQQSRMKPYFVSQEYNVNAYRDNYPMAGRFIFEYNNSNIGTRQKELTLVAMAEEPAVGWDFLGRFIEMYYVSERSADRSGSRRGKDGSRLRENYRRDNGIRNNTHNAEMNYSGLDDDDGRNTDFTETKNYTENNTNDTISMGRGRNITNTNESWPSSGKNNTTVNDENKMETTGRNILSGTNRTNLPDTVTTRDLLSYENEDPICQLTKGEKLRLCASIFASSVFRSRVKFFPTSDNVQFECEKKQISMMAEVVKPPPLMARITQWEIRESGRKSFEESMIGCRALTKDKNYKMTYLVSRGNYDNSIFVYTHKFSDRRVFVYNYFNNTSVI